MQHDESQYSTTAYSSCCDSLASQGEEEVKMKVSNAGLADAASGVDAPGQRGHRENGPSARPPVSALDRFRPFSMSAYV